MKNVLFALGAVALAMTMAGCAADVEGNTRTSPPDEKPLTDKKGTLPGAAADFDSPAARVDLSQNLNRGQSPLESDRALDENRASRNVQHPGGRIDQIPERDAIVW